MDSVSLLVLSFKYQLDAALGWLIEAGVTIYIPLREDLQGRRLRATRASTRRVNSQIGAAAPPTHSFAGMLPWHLFDNDRDSLSACYCSSRDSPAPASAAYVPGPRTKPLTTS